MGHIPFIVCHPEYGHGERRNELVQLIEIYPPVLSVLNRPCPPDRHGMDLLPVLREAIAKTRDYAIAGQFGNSVTITDGEWILHQSPVPGNQPLYWYGHCLAKFLPYELGPYVDGRREVYHYDFWPESTWLSHKKDDPNELVNITGKYPEKVGMQSAFKKFIASIECSRRTIAKTWHYYLSLNHEKQTQDHSIVHPDQDSTIAWYSIRHRMLEGNEMLRLIVKDVYQYKDSCNVYLLKSGSKGLLIDIGSGSILQHLQEAGVGEVELAVLTHAHRDQCSGLQDIIDHGAAIKAPQAERPYLGSEEVSQYWQLHFPLETSTTCFSVLREGFDEVDCSLIPGTIVEWGDFRLKAVEAGGHTPGQLAYMLRHPDGGNLLFCGDALYRGGKIWKGYSLDWDHWTDVGVQAATLTIERFRQLQPTLLAPSHGEVISGDADEQLSTAHNHLQSYGANKSFEHYNAAAGGHAASPRVPVKTTFRCFGKTVKQLSEHLFVQDNHYFLLSATKQCLMVDCGYSYMEQLVPEFLQNVGCSTVDVVIPSHAHYDHVEYLNILKDRHKTKIWALDLIRDVLEAPKRYWHPWSKWVNIQIDRTFQDGERVLWNEYELKFHWYPGQTAFAAAVETAVDGKRVLFSGDNFFPVEQWTGTGGIMGLNRGLPEGHEYSAEKTIAISPEWILAGHEFPFLYDVEEFRNRANWAREAQACMQRLSPGSRWRAHFDPHVVSVYPFLTEARRGEQIVVWLLGEESDLASPDGDWVWEVPKGFQTQLLARQLRQFDEQNGILPPPNEEQFARLGFSAGSLRMYPFQITVAQDADIASHAFYINSRRNESLDALCIVRVVR